MCYILWERVVRCDLISSSNHKLGKATWDKSPECKFSKIARVIYPKNCPNRTWAHWLITTNQQTFCIETNMF